MVHIDQVLIGKDAAPELSGVSSHPCRVRLKLAWPADSPRYSVLVPVAPNAIHARHDEAQRENAARTPPQNPEQLVLVC